MSECPEEARRRDASRRYEAVLKRLPEDYEPWGRDPRWADPETDYPDCSCGCRHFQPMEEGSADWGVCTNPVSHRAGLLTFEHQGCQAFERRPEEEPS